MSKTLKETIASGKWMITAPAFANLVANVGLMESGIVKKATVAEAPIVTTEHDNTPGANVGIIYINGVLLKGSYDNDDLVADTNYISNALDAFAHDPSVSNIVLIFNSPGGETTGIEELGRKIANIDSTIKPVYAWTETMACSAAYWLASQARSIGMTPSATVGSIGVYSLILDESKAMEQAGISVVPISSGKFKMIGHTFHVLTDEEKQILQLDVEAQHAKFKSAITSKRTVSDDVMQGLSYDGVDAVNNGLADVVVDSFDEFISTIEQTTISNDSNNMIKTEKKQMSANPLAQFKSVIQPLLPNFMKEATTPVVQAPAAEAPIAVVVAVAEAPAVKQEDPVEAPKEKKALTECPHCGGSLVEDPEDEDEDKPEAKATVAVATPIAETPVVEKQADVVAPVLNANETFSALRKAAGTNIPVRKDINPFLSIR